jgi:DUF2075 family protein
MTATSSLTGYQFGEIRAQTAESFSERSLQDLLVRFGRMSITPQQIEAWKTGTKWLWDAIYLCQGAPNDWQLILEYAPPLVGARSDALISTPDSVVSVEIKTDSAGNTSSSAKKQALSYAQDVWAYVLEARNRTVVPVLLTRTGLDHAQQVEFSLDVEPQLGDVQVLNPQGLSSLLAAEASEASRSNSDMQRWTYAPRPTIVQAAVAILAATEDPAVVTGLATDDELDRLVNDLGDLVREAKRDVKKVIALVTGVPGAGKTLVGLRLAHDQQLWADLTEGVESPLYLTGNGPLVQVLTEVLARDEHRRKGTPMTATRRAAKAKVLLVHSLTSQNLRIQTPLVIFDEGQRVWDEERMQSKHGEGVLSEAEEILVKLEDRPWAVLVVLLGTGQDINQGEEGYTTWLDALNARFHAGKEWLTYAPPGVVIPPDFKQPHVEDATLQLEVVRRTDNAANLSGWVNAVLDGDAKRAASIRSGFSDFPLYLTRDLQTAKEWLESKSKKDRGSMGLLASSKSARLHVYGVKTPEGARNYFDWVQWFLDRKPNLSSSAWLEVAASEFACQGLELDWTCVCWSWDLIREEGNWQARRLRSREGKWAHEEERARYRLNAYRVLLTRCRKGMVIWVPPGDADDKSRSASEADAVANFLISCGCSVLP